MAFGLYETSSAMIIFAVPRSWQFIASRPELGPTCHNKQWLLGIAGGRLVACELNHISEHLICREGRSGCSRMPASRGPRPLDLVQPSISGRLILRARYLARGAPRHAQNPRGTRRCGFVATVVYEHRDISIN